MENQKTREEIKYNALIGRIGTDYYFLDYIFKDGENFKGATGTVLETLTEEEVKQRNDDYLSEDEMIGQWREAVYAKATIEGFYDWLEMVKDELGEDAGIDSSSESEYSPILREILGEEAVYRTNCTGGGRCFSVDMQWDEIYNQELWEKIKEIETV